MYLLAVPPGTDSIVVVPNGDPAEGTEERGNLNIKDVCQAPLKLSSLKEHLGQTDGRKVKGNGGSPTIRQAYPEEIKSHSYSVVNS